MLGPGAQGLPRDVLRHLVDSRYSAVAAGGMAWARRTVREIHQTVVCGLQLTVSDTEAALAMLESNGLVTPVDTTGSGRHWIATPAGASAIELRSR